MTPINLDDEDVIPTTPTLYDINQSLDVIEGGIVGEEKARMVVFTNFVIGAKPIILRGSRASGKSHTMKVLAKYCRKPITISTSSEKVHSRMAELNSFSHFIIPEINQVHQVVLETLKAWGEGVASEYRYLNPAKIVETVIIQPKPFMTSIADENKNSELLGEELLSRMTIIRTDSGVNQNTKVIEYKMGLAENPAKKKVISKVKLNRLMKYVHELPDINLYKFVYPAGGAMVKAIPPLFTDSRRDVEKYLANTYAITLFHYKDRIQTMIDGKPYLVVSPTDMWYNHRIYQDILLESSLKCGVIEQEIITILQNNAHVLKKDGFGNAVKGMSASEIHTRLLQKSYTPTVESVKKFCNGLSQIGYLLCNDTTRPHRYEINPELTKNYNFTIDWNEIIEYSKNSIKNNFPDLYKEFLDKYCTIEALTVTDPFTGEKICLQTKPPEKLISFEPINIKENLLAILRDGLPRNSYDIAMQLKVDENEIETELRRLERLGDVFSPRPGFYKLL